MKNTKEAKAILTAIYVLSTSARKENESLATKQAALDEIKQIMEYAFLRLFDSNCNLLVLACVGKTFKQMKDEVDYVLSADTLYNDFKK